MQEFLYGNVFKKSFVILFLLSIFDCFILFSQDVNDKKSLKNLTLMQKANLKELELSSDEELRKWALKEGIEEKDVSKIKSLLLEKFGISPDLFSKDGKDGGRYKIVIESTDNLENFTYEMTEDENIVFKGKVNLIIEDIKNNKKHNIKGDKIIFNKNTKKLFSTGNVKYKFDLSTGENLYFYGSELFIDFDSQNFLLKNGVIQKKIHKNLVDHIVSFGGKVLRKLDNDTNILENAFITTSKIPEPYYSIRASKIWILPSGDFGILNALFYIGRVPIFYLPFFFKPGDSLFFNPSLGYFARKGLALFNTVYLLGQKSVDPDKSSFLDFDFHFAQNSDKKAYIRNGYLTYFFAEDVVFKVNKDYVKLLFDIYSNLGFYSGVDFNLSSTLDFFKTFEGSFGIGLTRTIHKHNFSGVYRPFARDSINYSLFSFDNINRGDIFGFEVPFRYLFKSKSEFLISDALFSVIFEHYSDPYVMLDFKDRLESATFFSILSPLKDSSETSNIIRTFDWKLSSFYNRTFDNNSLIDYRLNNLGFTFKLADYDNIYGKNGREPKDIRDPTRKWFYLERIYLPYIELNFQRDLYNRNWALSSVSKDKEIIMLPKVKDIGDDVEDGKDDGAKKSEGKKDLTKDLYLSPKPIVLNELNKQDSFYIRLGINPYLKNNIFFDASNIKSPQEFKYDVKTYLFDVKNKIDLKFYADFYNRFITFEDVLYLNTIEYNPLGKDYNLVDKDKKSEHSVINKINLNLFPFMMYPAFSRSSVKLENKVTIYSFDKKYDRDSKILSGKSNTVFWKSPETFHQEFNIGLIYDYRFFTTSLSSVLKNTFEHMHAASKLKFTLEFPYLLQEVGVGIKYDKKFNDDNNKSSLKKTSVQRSLSPLSPYKDLKMNPALYYRIEPRYLDYLKLVFLAAYDPLINGISELLFKINAYDFRFEFEMKNDFEYIYDKLLGDFEKVSSTTKIIPYSLMLQYKKDLYDFKFFDEKFKIGLGTDIGWKMNLQKFVDNELWAEFTLKFKYTKFFELNFSTRSINTKTFRYFGGYMRQLDLESVNLFADLFKSFNFFNVQDRKDSLFKIKKISTSFKFNFYDWKFVGEYSLSPDILKDNSGRYSAIWRNNFSIYISWNFFEPIKSSFENNSSTNYELLVNRKSKK
ncbi:LPS-assembly protein LptD [Borrelia coriaceae]|uniref:Organic solvent tolerance membrane protein n=1 Tax=Borrelia coriaceae ATCC 43381 TaxID=1408429 RepID=W5SVY2_9SPIR|nr:LPS-assembly protein LptD [Borrelia coriaceae]AHH11042.1 Organic solvent tolerance membrane protein [Borrelia coriaceae ATCC 43381]UPA16683.1 LPS-assembly protein LptD [Borrelia coriaceae]